MFTISVCMIVKNEKDTIGRILNCAKKIADEIIVVDTGSSDNTIEIATNFTDKVCSFKWNDNFAAARNFAFSKAACDYQMWLDADDFITDENIKKINALKNSSSNEIDVYMLKYSTGFDNENHPTLTYYRERLLKTSKNFKWQGFVHETISPSGKIEYLNIEIEHRKLYAGDPKRNLKLYRKAIKKGVKFNKRETYYYARELFYNNYISSAILQFKKFLKQPNIFTPDDYGAHIMLSDCYLMKNNKEKSLNTLFNCLKKHLPTAELCCKIAHVLDLDNEKDKAVFWYKTALSCPPQTFGFVNNDYSKIVPYIELSKLLYFTDKNASKEYYEKAKFLRPNHPSVLFNNQFFEN